MIARTPAESNAGKYGRAERAHAGANGSHGCMNRREHYGEGCINIVTQSSYFFLREWTTSDSNQNNIALLNQTPRRTRRILQPDLDSSTLQLTPPRDPDGQISPLGRSMGLDPHEGDPAAPLRRRQALESRTCARARPATP